MRCFTRLLSVQLLKASQTNALSRASPYPLPRTSEKCVSRRYVLNAPSAHVRVAARYHEMVNYVEQEALVISCSLLPLQIQLQANGAMCRCSTARWRSQPVVIKVPRKDSQEVCVYILTRTALLNQCLEASSICFVHHIRTYTGPC